MKHYGDITKISGYDAPIVDCVVGGSPCQDLSIAGKREGLAGERSGLYDHQIRIVEEMRERDRNLGRTGADVRPRYMVWENVPGAFSSHGGGDFRIVLEKIAKVADKDAVIPRPADGKWRTSGCIVADGWSIAWRVLDAQFWGTSSKPLPQRRRRIALVADFGGQSASEILFVRQSVLGNLDESEPKREAASYAPQGGVGADYRDRTLCFGISSYNSNFMLSSNPNSGIYSAGTSRTLDANGGNPTCNQGGIVVVEPVPYTLKIRSGCEGGGKGALIQTDKSATLSTLQDQTLFQPVCFSKSKIAQTAEDYETWVESEQANTLNAFDTGDVRTTEAVIAAVDCRNGTENLVSGSLQSNAAHSLNGNNVVRHRYIVRRLTPIECERLQGFPDGWTDIGEWVDSNGKKRQTSDAARYKALGNSIALPPWKWVLKRLCACYERDATMASLFDGIGGFPYIWEQLNGKGSCLWASEIEEFPMAVTKVRIGGD